MLNAGLQVVDVLLRWMFSAPQVWVADVYALTLPIAIAACFPLTLSVRGMINIEAVGRKLGPLAYRILRVVADLALLVFFAIMSWQIYKYAQTALAARRTSFYEGFPVAPTWFLVAAFLAFGTLIQAFIASRSLVDRLPPPDDDVVESH